MKAVIPAAGLGTRFLPYTKAQPKEMLPVLDKPAIQYVVEEALDSGIRDIVIITGRGKRAIEDHFDSNPELDAYLRKRGKDSILDEMRRVLERARISYIRQRDPLGNGHAVLCAESAIGAESFAVLLGDDIMIGRTPCTKSLAKLHEKIGASCIAAQRVPRERVGGYGMIVGTEIDDGLFRIEDIVEKPTASRITSDLVTIGRYVFSPELFGHLRKLPAGKGGEIWLSGGIRSLLRSEDVYAWSFDGRRFDIGTSEGWLLANLELAWSRSEYRHGIEALIRQLNVTPL